MLPYFFQHYDPWVSKYIIYDDGSTDGSQSLLASHPRVEIKECPPLADKTSRVESSRKLKNTCWHQSKGDADWVIVTDLDEHLYHKNITIILRNYKERGVTIIPACGYEMVSNEFPAKGESTLLNLVKEGVPSRLYSKISIFNPSAIHAINYEPGCHGGRFSGKTLAPEIDELRLLHFHYLGIDRVVARHQLYRNRLLEMDIQNKFGEQYTWSKEQLLRHFSVLMYNSINVLNHKLYTHPCRDLYESIERIKWTQLCI